MDKQMLEARLAEYLDNLLVSNNILPQRRTRLIMPPRGMTGMIMSVIEKPRVNFKIEIFPNETEEPHFKVTYQNCSCRFNILDCSPVKAESKNGIPVQIKKIMKEIQKTWSDNKKDIISTWNDLRPSNQNHGHQHIRE